MYPLVAGSFDIAQLVNILLLLFVRPLTLRLCPAREGGIAELLLTS